MRVSLIDCGSSKVGEIEHLLRRGSSVSCQRVMLADATTSDWSCVDALVVSGGPRLFTEQPQLLDAFSFLDPLSQPVLGICLGHQAIALRAGAQVYLGAERREPEPIALLGEHPLFEGIDSPATFREDHCEGVSLPQGFERLASSEHYPVEAMVDRQRPRVGVQFHPEVSGETGARLLHNFLVWARSALPVAKGGA
jgi:GMP synthase-like glutamine amidotransferase